ncbi:hypothetical protein MMPV_005617 [Pyropia vietnamensis]
MATPTRWRYPTWRWPLRLCRGDGAAVVAPSTTAAALLAVAVALTTGVPGSAGKVTVGASGVAARPLDAPDWRPASEGALMVGGAPGGGADRGTPWYADEGVETSAGESIDASAEDIIETSAEESVDATLEPTLTTTASSPWATLAATWTSLPASVRPTRMTMPQGTPSVGPNPGQLSVWKHAARPTMTAIPATTPTVCPKASQTASPTVYSTDALTASPTAVPTATLTAVPTATLTAAPSVIPTSTPTASLTGTPIDSPTATPEADTAPYATPVLPATATFDAQYPSIVTPTPAAVDSGDTFVPVVGPPAPPPALKPWTSGAFPMWTGRPSVGVRSFSALPATGVHPRLFFTPEDLPAMRKALLDREGELPKGWKMDALNLRGSDPAHLLGVTSYLFIRDAVASGYDYGDPPLFEGVFADVYQRLSKGDLSVDLSTIKLYGSNVASAGQGRDGLYGKLSGAGFVSLLREEGSFQRGPLATALATTCTLHARTYTPGAKRGFHHDMAVDLGIAYDMLADAMTPDQRRACVTLMGTMIRGREELGTDGFQSRPYQNNYNHIGWHAHIHVLAHVMEGENGDGGDEGDLWKTTLPIGIDVQKKFVSQTITEGSLGRESGGYFAMGWYWALPANIIFARRGFNVFTDPQLGDHFYRGLLFYFTAQVPLSEPLSVWDGRHHDDLPSGQRPRYQCIMAWLYGSDALAQHQLANSWPSQIPTSGDAFMCALFPPDNRGGGGTVATVAATKDIPLTLFDRDKGELTVRSSWADDALALNFESRLDTYRLGHVHASRNSFYLYAGGRPWVIDQTRADVENLGHSTVLIDGVGQSGGGDSAGRDLWPSFPAVWNEMSDGTSLTVAAADAKYAYAYSQRCAAPYKCINNTFTAPAFGFVPDPYQPAWMEGFPVGPKTVSVFNPVVRAFRTVAFAKGPTPFVLIVDDIQKDTAEHTYEWVVNVPLADTLWRHEEEDVNVDDEYASSNGRDLVLRYTPDAKAGTPRLLLRVLRAEGEMMDGGLRVRDRKVRIRDSKVAAKKGFKREESIRTASFSVRTVTPHFVVLAWPFLQGELLPETSMEGSGVVTVARRRFQLTPNADGRTRVAEM